MFSSSKVLGDNTAVMCGLEGETRKIKSYDLTTGQELQSLNLEDAFRLAEVKLSGKPALAVSVRFVETHSNCFVKLSGYILRSLSEFLQSFFFKNQNYFRSRQKIEFRDANDLSQILHTHSVAPQEPYGLYAATPSTLLYVDGSKQPREVNWLELSELEPKTTVRKPVIHLHNTLPKDMCFTQDGDKQLLIIATIDGGLFACNIETDKLEWEVRGKLPGMEQAMNPMGVTTDGRGCLYVSDYENGNKSIQMFSVSDGVYQGCLMKDVDAHGAPAGIRWCDSKSSLVAAFGYKGKWHLKVINVQF